MTTTPHRADQQEKAEPVRVPPGGKKGPTSSSASRRAGYDPGPARSVIALRHHPQRVV